MQSCKQSWKKNTKSRVQVQFDLLRHWTANPGLCKLSTKSSIDQARLAWTTISKDYNAGAMVRQSLVGFM